MTLTLGLAGVARTWICHTAVEGYRPFYARFKVLIFEDGRTHTDRRTDAYDAEGMP